MKPGQQSPFLGKGHQIIQTKDGSKTIYLPEIDEQYHSVNGALTESGYVYIEKGYLFREKQKTVVFEVGFGTGLNCILTAIEAEKERETTHYYSIEKFPLEKYVTKELGHSSLFPEKDNDIYEKIHSCEWGKMEKISEHFFLHKIHSSIHCFNLSALEKFDVIYFDAFGPDKQPDMWTPKIFNSIYGNCNPNAVFVTYSAKGEIRRQLTKAGFTMEKLPGPPGKKQMLRGIKKG